MKVSGAWCKLYFSGKKYFQIQGQNIVLTRSLDREKLIHKLNFSSKLKAIVKCTIPKTSERFKKRISVEVHDTDDNFPSPADEYVIELNKTFVKEVSTVWKFQDFSVIQILRETNFGESRSSKSAVLCHFGPLHIVNLEHFSFQKVQKCIKIKIQSL